MQNFSHTMSANDQNVEENLKLNENGSVNANKTGAMYEHIFWVKLMVLYLFCRIKSGKNFFMNVSVVNITFFCIFGWLLWKGPWNIKVWYSHNLKMFGVMMAIVNKYNHIQQLLTTIVGNLITSSTPIL